ncbi:class III extradiol ring-cleavage dioxygenase [Sorangium sp. So ce136]|uniref:dioxygenase family protein n=1 Tax=Sorangium sp. So ce136 TaxID=3133284 RepID=UPI003F025FEF
MDRRAALKLLAAGGVLPIAGACRPSTSTEGGPMSETQNQAPVGRMPALFLAHGSPFLLDDRAWVAELGAWARAVPRPRAILMLSAHWVDAPVKLGATETAPLVYDFYNFPEKYYGVTYPAPGAPALARRVRELLGPLGPVAEDPRRGLDHGAYVPLICMYPGADVPVLQVSLPTLAPAPLLAMGRALAPLRDEGILLVGSGFLTHNLRAADWRTAAVAQPWATEFDAWCAEVLARRDVDALLDYRARAPGVRMALPTHEHFVPVVAAMGASIDVSEPVGFPITGLTYGSFTKRSVQFG